MILWLRAYVAGRDFYLFVFDYFSSFRVVREMARLKDTYGSIALGVFFLYTFDIMYLLVH